MHSIARRLRVGAAAVAVIAAIAGPLAPSVLAVPTHIATVTTTLRTNTGTTVTTAPVGTQIHPFVLVSGSAGTPTGSVTIRLWKSNGTCSGAPTTAGTYSLISPGFAQPTSMTATSTDATSWSYQSQYSGDGTYFLAISSCRSFTFTKVAPTSVVIKLQNPSGSVVTSVPFGTAVHPIIDVAGSVGSATGAVQAGKWQGTNCTGNSALVSTGILVGGVGNTNASFTAPLPGTYWFQGFYEGDSTYTSAKSPCVTLTVQKVAPVFTVQLWDQYGHKVSGVVALGNVVHATVILNGTLGLPSGSVISRRYPTADCSGAYESTTTTAISGSLIDPAGPAYYPDSPSTHSWRLFYGGDSKYNAAVSACLPVTWKAYTVITMDVRTAGGSVVTSVPVGTDVHPRLSLSAAFGAPTGSVTIEWFGNDACSGDGISLGTRTLAAGGLDDPTVHLQLTTAQAYSFKATYGGDGAYRTSASCAAVTATALPDPTPKPTAAPTAAPTPKPTPNPTGAPGTNAEPAGSTSAPDASTDDPAASAAPAATEPGATTDPGIAVDPAATADPGTSSGPVADGGNAAPSDQPVAAGSTTATAPAGEVQGVPLWLLVLVLLVAVGLVILGFALTSLRRRSRGA